jgi:hypothetical protein
MSSEEYIAITIYQDSNTRDFKEINYSDDVQIITENEFNTKYNNNNDETNLLDIENADEDTINDFFQKINIFNENNEKTEGGYKENKNEKKYGYSTKVRKSFKNIQRNIRNKTLKV